MSIKINCISKDSGNHENPYVAIESLTWINEADGKTGTTTRETMYDWVVNKNGVAYVTDALGNTAYLVGAISPRGTRYVKTVADETTTDNLLTLPECR